MIFALISNQDQPPYVVTSCRLVVRSVLVYTRLADRVGLLLSVNGILPIVWMTGIKYTVLNM